MTTRRALVLGGGGLAGIAWETGVLAALAEAGVDPVIADRIVGTSAGANVAAQLASGVPLGELFERQADPARQTHELVPDAAVVAEVFARWQEVAAQAEAEATADSGDPHRFARQAGEFALNTATVSEAIRRAVIDARLPVHAWPQRWPADKLLLTAVDAYSGELRVFDRASGVGLVDAVGASSAVPGVWPPVTIGDSRYVDGGVRSSTNADLAADCDSILILAPSVDPALEGQIAALRRGAYVELVAPDDETLAAFGANPLDPAVRTPAAQAGYRQGVLAVNDVARLWSRG